MEDNTKQRHSTTILACLKLKKMLRSRTSPTVPCKLIVDRKHEFKSATATTKKKSFVKVVLHSLIMIIAVEIESFKKKKNKLKHLTETIFIQKNIASN